MGFLAGLLAMLGVLSPFGVIDYYDNAINRVRQEIISEDEWPSGPPAILEGLKQKKRDLEAMRNKILANGNSRKPVVISKSVVSSMGKLANLFPQIKKQNENSVKIEDPYSYPPYSSYSSDDGWPGGDD